MKKSVIGLLVVFALIISYVMIFEYGKGDTEAVIDIPLVVTKELVYEQVDIKVMAPLGSPALAQTFMQYEMPSLGPKSTYEVEIVVGVDPLVAAFTSGSHDIIYAPTNLAAKLYNMGTEYIFAGSVVCGNLYLITTTEEEFTMDYLDGKEIVVFGQNATPDVVIQAILNNHEFENPPTLRYVPSAPDAQAEFIMDNTKVVLLAEPVISATKMKVSGIKSIDLQEEWEVLTGAGAYPQAGVFVKKELIETRKDVVDNYLKVLEISTRQANENPSVMADYAVELGYGFPKPVLVNAIAASHIQFYSAEDAKHCLLFYFNEIMELNPALLGDAFPDDDFYYN